MNKPIDFTKPVRTKGDKRHKKRPVTILSTNGREPYPIVGYVDSETTPAWWTRDGKVFLPNEPYPDDLENVPVKRKHTQHIIFYRDRYAPNKIHFCHPLDAQHFEDCKRELGEGLIVKTEVIEFEYDET